MAKSSGPRKCHLNRRPLDLERQCSSENPIQPVSACKSVKSAQPLNTQEFTTLNSEKIFCTFRAVNFLFLTNFLHSQKQSAHWAADVTAEVVPCWLGSWLNCNLWLVLVSGISLYYSWVSLESTGVHCRNDSGDIQLSERKITWVSFIWTHQFSLHLISPFNWISTESWPRWWYTVEWAIFSESVFLTLYMYDHQRARFWDCGYFYNTVRQLPWHPLHTLCIIQC